QGGTAVLPLLVSGASVFCGPPVQRGPGGASPLPWSFPDPNLRGESAASSVATPARGSGGREPPGRAKRLPTAARPPTVKPSDPPPTAATPPGGTRGRIPREIGLRLRNPRLSHVPQLDLLGQDLALDPFAMRVREGAIGLGQREDDPVGELEAGVTAHRVHLVDEIEDASLETQLIVELSFQLYDKIAVFREGPAVANGLALDEDLFFTELDAVDAPPPVRQGLDETSF